MVLKGLRDLGGFLIEDFSGGVSFRLFYACPCMHLINGGSGVPSLGRLENFLLFFPKCRFVRISTSYRAL